MSRPSDGRVFVDPRAWVLGALLGSALGFGVHAALAPAPPACDKALTLADGIFEDYEAVSYSVVLMSTRGQSEYAGHEADANRLWDEIGAAKKAYQRAKASCLGGAR